MSDDYKSDEGGLSIGRHGGRVLQTYVGEGVEWKQPSSNHTCIDHEQRSTVMKAMYSPTQKIKNKIT